MVLLAQAQVVDHTAELLRQLPAILTAAGIVITALFGGIGAIITLIFTRLGRIKEGTDEVHKIINSEWDKFKADHKAQSEKDTAEAIRLARAEAEKTAKEVALEEMRKATAVAKDYEARLADADQKLAVETLRTNMTPAVAFAPQAVSPDPVADRPPAKVVVVNPPSEPVPTIQAEDEREA